MWTTTTAARLPRRARTCVVRGPSRVCLSLAGRGGGVHAYWPLWHFSNPIISFIFLPDDYSENITGHRGEATSSTNVHVAWCTCPRRIVRLSGPMH